MALGAVAGSFIGSPLIGSFGAAALLAAVGPRIRLRLNSSPSSVLAGGATIVVVAIGIALLALSFFRPVVGWDGIAIWTLKARALAASGSFSESTVFTTAVYGYSHPHYPPLLPSWQAVALQLAGDSNATSLTQVQFAVLWLSGALMVIGLSAQLYGSASVILASWLIAPFVITHAMSGYADVPMALFLVCGGIAALLARGPVLPALLFASAALTKTEGLIFVLLLAFIITSRRGRQWITLAIIPIAAIAPWSAFTRWHGLPDYMLNLDTVHPLRVASLIPARLPRILAAIASEVFLTPKRWGMLVPSSLAAPLLGRPDRHLGFGSLAAIAVVALTYIATPFDLVWHLHTSLNRILIAPLGIVAWWGASTIASREDRHASDHSFIPECTPDGCRSDSASPCRHTG